MEEIYLNMYVVSAPNIPSEINHIAASIKFQAGLELGYYTNKTSIEKIAKEFEEKAEFGTMLFIMTDADKKNLKPNIGIIELVELDGETVFIKEKYAMGFRKYDTKELGYYMELTLDKTIEKIAHKINEENEIISLSDILYKSSLMFG